MWSHWVWEPQNFCDTLVLQAEQGGHGCAQALEEPLIYGGTIPVSLYILVSSCCSVFVPPMRDETICGAWYDASQSSFTHIRCPWTQCAHPCFSKNVPRPTGAPRQYWESCESVPSRCPSFPWLHWECGAALCSVWLVPGVMRPFFVQGSASQHFRLWWICGFATRAGCFRGSAQPAAPGTALCDGSKLLQITEYPLD